jgi:hypothetical protein
MYKARLWADHPSSTSHQCQTTLLNVLASPDATCLNLQQALPYINAPDDESLVTPFGDWLKGVCAAGAPECTNDELESVVENVTTGCDLWLFGFPPEDESFGVPELVQLVQRAYLTIRKVACLKE